MTPHPRGARTRVLLTSVFGPFARDDEYGSRTINPMELYHNQVTREQGPFSLRMFHRSWGIMLIQQNISAPSTVLDFPTREQFIDEITSHHHDVIGISGIIVNIGKVREMCRLARKHSPASTVVIGGHVTAIPGIERMVDADHIVRGEGVAWFREFLGESTDLPIRHPAIASSFGFRLMGLPMPAGGGNPAATIIPSVGCPMGCNFCTTSAFFGGKGNSINFYNLGSEVFDVMCEVEARLGVSCFFVMDENFLLDKKRALELLDCMKRHGKAWSMYVFSSANAIKKYDMRQLVELGVTWIWLGLESSSSAYSKLKEVDTLALTQELQHHGICVHGSTIVGLEHHTPENIVAEIEHAVAHDAACHQFMLYTPVPGTPLHDQMEVEGRLLPDADLADIHGQYKFNFRHEAISRDESKSLLDWAFRLDFERNGPTVYRRVRTMLAGWRRYHRDKDPRVRARIANDCQELRQWSGAVLWAAEKYMRRSNRAVSDRVRALRAEVEREFGLLFLVTTRVVGPVLLWSSRREARRFPAGPRLEPRMFLERRNCSVAK
ncbi:MAG: B12-binding domain-containing radical SAM protein [Acidobacteria bacterium]|nr:B12-binding domain-containing radical SAM protein [Acidobacteriota bacterium]HJN46390.1 cobalamin-dependent protein [Vicinamibacterales bacterium]